MISNAENYLRDGFLFPLDVFTHKEANLYLSHLKGMENRLGETRLGPKGQITLSHTVFRFANQIVRNSKILDVVEAILGKDILVWGSTFFIKEPKTETFVSWHQDLRYWGLNDEEGLVSAWVALSSANGANGCMRFLPFSHKKPILKHHDTFDKINILTRGQEADVEIDESVAVHCELKPGQASFHHGRMLHASGPNTSHERRVGLAIQYISPHVKQTVAREDYAMLVRGKDRYSHFQLIPEPDEDLSEKALYWHNRISTSQEEVYYEGTDCFRR